MSAVNAFPSHEQSDIGSETRNNSEPSMEDILASIRRIIADDQSRHAPSALRRPNTNSAAPVATPTEPDMAPSEPDQEPEMDAGEGSIVELVAHPSITDEAHPAGQGSSEPRDAAPEVAEASGPEPVLPPEIAEDHHDAVIEEIASAGVASVLRPFMKTDRAPDVRPEPMRPAAPRPMPQPPVQEAVTRPLANGSDWAAEREDMEAAPLVSPAIGASIESTFQTLATSVLLQNTDMVERMMREMLRPLLKTWLDDNLPTIVERLVRIEIERVARGGRG